MRRYITIFVLLIINFLLQTTVFRYIEIAHMVPNLILVVTVAAGLLYGRKCGIFAGVISGLLTDALYGSVIGIGILIYSVVGYLCGAASKLYFEEDLTVPIVWIHIIRFYINHCFPPILNYFVFYSKTNPALTYFLKS